MPDPAYPRLTTSQSARILEVSAEQVRHYAERGLLPFERTARGRLFDREAVERFAAERRLRKTVERLAAERRLRNTTAS